MQSYFKTVFEGIESSPKAHKDWESEFSKRKKGVKVGSGILPYAILGISVLIEGLTCWLWFTVDLVNVSTPSSTLRSSGT